MITGSTLVAWLSDVDHEDDRYIGKKFAALGEMVQAGFPVPNGFILPAHTYKRFIAETGIETKIRHLLGTLNFSDPNSLSQVTLLIKRLISTTEIPKDIIDEVFRAYHMLEK